jgi:transcriptional regulator with PAS, ATPase and Fis domain
LDIKIGILSQSQQFIDLALELSKEVYDTEIFVEKTTIKSAQQDAMMMESRGVDIILARGEPAKEIEKVAKVPVVKCRLSMLDLTRNLKGIDPNLKCLISGHMFFTPTFKEICLEIERIMDIRLDIFYYHSLEDLREILNKAKENNVDIVLGGYIIVAAARRIGLKSKELLFDKQTVLEIIHSARKIVEENRKIEKESKWLKSVIDFTKQGIIAIDNKGTISNLNKKAQYLLGLTDSNLSNESIVKHLPDLKLPIEKGQSSKENIVQIHKQKIVLDFNPLYIQNEYIGGLISLENVHNIQNLEHKIRKTLADRGLVAKFKLDNIIGSSEIIKRTIKIAETFAKTDFNILISGETGTGKELFAQGIHLTSLRYRGPFVAINCAALPKTLLESELFGYEEGAFSGARKGGKLGLFELAHHGTIFLDEINSIPLAIQSRLLRAIEEKEILRVGGDKIIPIDVRIIAATNEDLNKSIADGEFRKDLYYRINELNLTIPPLRKRKGDIPELVHLFLKDYESKYKAINTKTENHINEIIKNHFFAYHWPGNVRELSNLVKRCVVLLETIEDPGQLQAYFSEDNFSDIKKSDEVITVKQGTLAEMEEELVKVMISKFGYNKSELANKLNISRSTLWRILKDSN